MLQGTNLVRSERLDYWRNLHTSHASRKTCTSHGTSNTNFCLAASFCSRNRATTLEQHTDCLLNNSYQTLEMTVIRQRAHTAAVSKKVFMLLSGSSLTNWTENFPFSVHDSKPKSLTSIIYFNTAGMTPAAPFVGDVTIRPPEALTSLTAIA